jgi:hypothetical protein
MHTGPSKTAEAVAAVFIPPACREELLGDLHERYSSSRQYGLDAVRTIPLVIISRIRRTVDPQVLVMQAFALYASFLSAAWLRDRALLSEQWGLLRLVIPAGMAMLGLILEDAYAKPGRRSPLKLVRGPALGLALALASQGMFRISNPDLALPSWIAFYGSGLCLLLSSAIRMLFPPATDQRQANVRADWLKRSGGSFGNAEAASPAVTFCAAIVAVITVAAWIAERAALPKGRFITLMLVLMIAYQVWKRA